MTTVPHFLTDEGFNKLKANYRVRKVLQREGKVYLRELHGRCGVGLTVEEFDTCIEVLADTGWCSVQVGRQGAKLVVLNEEYANTHLYTPEEVIADAMKVSQ
ncbi:MAG: hypothetical protein ABSE82_15485 [Nitrososphaerales archaeon]|jgi:hypothetical protein